MRYQPINLGRWIVWGATALLMIVLPLVFTKGFAITLMSQMGIMIIFTLSYNMLLGQTGLLSFGHAVYSGLGAYIAVHVLNMASKGQVWMPVSLLPLVSCVVLPVASSITNNSWARRNETRCSSWRAWSGRR